MLIVLLFTSIVALFSYKRTLRYLHACQQDEYSSSRFLKWFIQNHAYDTRGTAIIASVLIVSTLLPWQWTDVLVSLIGVLAFVIAYIWERDPRQHGKLLLNMTERAKRILYVCCVFIVAHSIAVICLFWNHTDFAWLGCLALIQLTPFYLMATINILKPQEKSIQKKFMQEAYHHFRKVNPYTIAITGSFGKSSVKNALGDVMQVTVGSTFWPNHGINTKMGITRHIREYLNIGHAYAIIEMAAYRKGSIAALCDFTPPQIGIITAIGAMHLERFGSLETIYEAKTELARAIPDNGTLICNGDDPGARRAAQEHAKQTTLLYGFDNSQNDLACHMANIGFSNKGSTFELMWKDKKYSGQTQLLGRPALSNLMAVFTASCALGACPEFVIAAIANIQPMKNRLSIEKAGNTTYIMDAYNSNPSGFRSALEVLSALGQSRKILMTPGMVELGQLQFEENYKIGQASAAVCDLVLLVGDTNRDALKRGLLDEGFPAANIKEFNKRDDAFVALKELTNDGDTILIENDLPDLYEHTFGF